MGIRTVLTALALLAMPAANAGVLRVESASGATHVQRGEEGVRLEPGYDLAEGDVIRVSSGARATLALGRHGYLDLGPGSELAVERLPFSSFADDLRTVLRLKSGYLRVVWKYPDLASRWPLSVFLDAYAAQLDSGEYFFDRAAGRDVACVGSGQAQVTGGPAATTLTGPACYRLTAGAMPDARRREYSDFIDPRERFALADLGDRPASPGPVPVPRPVPVASAAPAPVVTPPPEAPKLPSRPTAAPTRDVSPAEPARPKPAPQVAVAEPVKGSPASTGGDRWIVNVASYPTRAEADAHLARLAAGGREGASIEEAQVKGRTWYRVQMRDIAGKPAAQRLADELKSRGESSDAWLSRQK